MNSRGVQDSLKRNLQFQFFFILIFLNYIIYKNYTENFWQNFIPLSKNLNNITNHWFPHRIKLKLSQVKFIYHTFIVNNGFGDSNIFNTNILVKLAIAYMMIWCFIL